jgi:hypothetical protein
MISIDALEYYTMMYDVYLENEDKLNEQQLNDMLVTKEVLIKLHQAKANGHNVTMNLNE